MSESEPKPHVPNISEIKEIIIAGSAADLVQAIRALDSYLVPKGVHCYKQGDLEDEVGKFLQNIKSYQSGSLQVYLGDGGMSRFLICVDDVKNDKFIIDVSEFNSSPEVIDRWKQLNNT